MISTNPIEQAGIDRAFGPDEPDINPKGRIDVPGQAAGNFELGQTEEPTRQVARLAGEAARFGYMADALGARIIRPAGFVGDRIDARPRRIGLRAVFGTTHSQYDPGSGRVVTKTVARARPMKTKPSNNKPGSRAPAKGKKR